MANPHCLPFSTVPHTTRLFADFLSWADSARPFYPRNPRQPWTTDDLRVSHDAERQARVADVLIRQNHAFGQGQGTFDNLERLRRGAAAIVSGQQAGLFGGPLYAVLKVASLLRLTDDLRAVGGNVVPVFWVATEDHDLAEVNHVVLPGEGAALHTLVTTSQGGENVPVAEVPLNSEITSLVEQAAALLGPSPVLDAVREAYRPGESLGTAFARLFAFLFRETGIILLDPADPELHAVALPIYRAALDQGEELTRVLLDRGKQLENSGYHQQVKVTASSTLLFARHQGARVPVHRSNGDFRIADERVSRTDLLRRIQSRPAEFSPNVLLRPVVQDFLLPTVAYIGGPAEVAYFAQAGVVYDQLLRRRTPVIPRFSATLVDGHVKRLLDRYGLVLPDFFHGPEQLRDLIARRSLPENVQASFEDAERLLRELLARLEPPLEQLDPTLLEAAHKSGRKMEYQLRRLHARAARAELRRSAELSRHADELSAMLFPQKQLQERVLGGVYFLARHGLSLMDTLHDAASPTCVDHQVIYL